MTERAAGSSVVIPIKTLLRALKSAFRAVCRPFQKVTDIREFNHRVLRRYKREVRGAIQVGAHHGIEYPWFKGIQNLLFFEPQPEAFEKLQRNVGPEVLLAQKAVGAENKTVEMFVETVNQGQSSSVLSPQEHSDLYPSIVFEGKIAVEQVRLDDYLMENHLEGRFNFLEIDVQGYELEVLKGAQKLLRDIDYLYCEVNKTSVYKNCALVDEVDAFLSQFGFFRHQTVWVKDAFGDALYLKQKPSWRKTFLRY